jgi:hypothetical protein
MIRKGIAFALTEKMREDGEKNADLFRKKKLRTQRNIYFCNLHFYGSSLKYRDG